MVLAINVFPSICGWCDDWNKRSHYQMMATKKIRLQEMHLALVC